MGNAYDIGYDLTFELDKFNKPRLCGEAELVKNVLLTILFGKPGNFPSLPNVGMNIQSRLFSFYDEITESGLRDEIIAQCGALGAYFKHNRIYIKKIMYKGQPSLLIHVETDFDENAITSLYSDKETDDINKFNIGITFDELDHLIYNVNTG
jgi:hypothetical protein